MKRLLYISTARSTLRSSELGDLLIKARKANLAADISGLLVVGGKRFLQVLEGPEVHVDATYERIARDPRHFALVKLHDKSVTERSFADWAMGYERSGIAAEASGTLDDQVRAIVAAIEDPTLRAYFEGFVQNHTSA